MIRYSDGDIFKSECEALVNPVNCVGVSGKGLAKEFKKRFPDNQREYELTCRRGSVAIGGLHVTWTHLPINPKYIINFPTKIHWSRPSELSFIIDGLVDLCNVIRKFEIMSIAIPALGCGNGGLGWKEVDTQIQSRLFWLTNTRIVIYPPQ